MTTAAVILAAGFSRRLGRPKQSVLLGGQTLLQHVVTTAKAANCTPVIVVVRPALDTPEVSALDGGIVLNEDASEGMASSVRKGIAALTDTAISGALLLTCDQPLLRAEHLQALASNSLRITGSAYAGRVGVPAYFPRQVFAALLELQGDTGARDLLRTAFAIPDEDLALDIDTEDDLRRAEQHLVVRART